MWPQEPSSDTCFHLPDHSDSTVTQSRSAGNQVFENSVSQSQYHPVTQTKEFADGVCALYIDKSLT